MVSAERLLELENAERKLKALEIGGVDNWEFYGASLEALNAELELEEELDSATEDLTYELCQLVDEPAGPGAGYGITDKAALKVLMNGFLETVKGIINKGATN